MEAIYVWPANPVASLFVVWLSSAVFLWAAREPMCKLFASLGGGLADGLEALGARLAEAASSVRARAREVLLAAGTRDAQGRLDRELQRVDEGFSARLGQYSRLHRRLDDQLLALERDYQECGVVPPEVPGWSTAVETIAGIPMTGDPNVQRVLEGIRKSSQEAERKALKHFRDDSARRHKMLGAMLPCWKEIRGLLARMHDSVGLALESPARINAFVEDYEKIRQDSERAARTLTFSAGKLFLIAAIVLAIALGGAFINFQLIALPMSELVPAGARVGGMPVATVAALVLVLMEAALGIFLMDMLGITELFPKLATIPRSRRRLILGLGLAALLFFAGVESSLAVLREQIVEAESALKLSLAGESSRLVQSASESMIPVIGQAVLGFVLPWVLALVAIPLEMLLDSGRHVMAWLIGLVLVTLSQFAHAAAHVIRHATGLVTNCYDVYIGIPLRIEAWVRGRRGDREHSRTSLSASGEVRGEGLA